MHTPATKTENKASKSSAPNGTFFGQGQAMPFFQAKLTVNQPGDAYEQEADRVADQVMRMPDPVQRNGQAEKNGTAPVEIQRQVNNPPPTSAPVAAKQPPSIPVRPIAPQASATLVQAKCDGCAQKEKEQKEEEREQGKIPVMRMAKTYDINGTSEVPVQRACAECAKAEALQRREKTPDIAGAEPIQIQRACADCGQDDQLMRKADGGDPGGQAAPSVVSDVLSSGGGRPMDAGTRGFMESRFGQDFGQVRIHTGGQAAESAAAINARAYTSGHNVVFGDGEYQPETDSGKRLLAHELVHVGQQGEGAGHHRWIQSKGETTTPNSPGPAAAPVTTPSAPNPPTFSEAQGNIQSGITLDVDVDGDIFNKEIRLVLKLSGGRIDLEIKHANSKPYTTIFGVPTDDIKPETIFIQEVGTTDGLRVLPIILAGESATGVKKLKLGIRPLPKLGQYDLSIDDIPSETIDLNIASMSGLVYSNLTENQPPQKEGSIWKISFLMGGSLDKDVKLWLQKDPEIGDGKGGLLFFSMANAGMGGRGIQTGTSTRNRIRLPVTFEELVITPKSEDFNALTYSYTPSSKEGFMVRYQVRQMDSYQDISKSAVHQINIYPVNGKQVSYEPVVSESFKQKNNYWIYSSKERTVGNFRFESAKDVFRRIAETTLPENEIATLTSDIGAIALIAVNENIIRQETYKKWIEFSYSVHVYQESARNGDITAQDWIRDKAEAFISAFNLENEDLSSPMYEEVYGGGGAPHKTFVQASAIQPDLAAYHYDKVFVELWDKYFRWIEDSLLYRNLGADIDTLKKLGAYSDLMSFNRQKRKRLLEADKPLIKVNAWYYPDLGNIRDEHDNPLKVNSKFTALPLDLYYQDKGTEWILYNFTDFTTPGQLHGFKRNQGKKAKEVLPPQQLFNKLTGDKGMGEGYVHYELAENVGGVVRISHPWTLGDKILAVGVVIGLLALAATGVGLLVEGGLAVGTIGASAAMLGNIAAVTVAVGTVTKLGEDYAAGDPISVGRLGEAALDIATALLPMTRTLRSVSSLTRFKTGFILLDKISDSRLLAKLDIAANATGLIVSTARGAEEVAAVAKAVAEGKADDMALIWAITKNVGLGAISVVMLKSDIETLRARSIGNQTLPELTLRGKKLNILTEGKTKLYSEESFQQGIDIMTESSSPYRAMVLEATLSESQFKHAADVLCYLGLKGRGSLEDVVVLDGKVRRAIDVLIEAKFFGKHLAIPQGFKGSKGETLDTVERDFHKFSEAVLDGVHAVPGLRNAEIRMQGSSVIGINRPKKAAGTLDTATEPPKPGPATAAEPTAPAKAAGDASEPKWDVDLAIMVSPDDFAVTLAAIFQKRAKAKTKPGPKEKSSDLDLVGKTPNQIRALARDIMIDEAKPLADRIFNAEARTFAQNILSGKANMSASNFPKLSELKAALMAEFGLPKIDLSVIANDGRFDSAPYLTLQKPSRKP